MVNFFFPESDFQIFEFFFKKIKFRFSNIFCLLIFLSLNFGIISCNKKSVNVITAKPNVENNTEDLDKIITKNVDSFEDLEDTEIKTPPTVLIPKDYVVASLEKTECYGKCPSFEFKIYSNGIATFHGKKFVSRYGEFKAKIDEASILRIKEKGKELGILNLSDTYPENRFFLNDLPMSYLIYNNGLTKIVIRNNHDAPRALLEFEKYLEVILNRLEWKRVEGP